MDLQNINPINDPNWDNLLLTSGDFSFFHTAAWARVISRSYGYEPAYFFRTENGRLSFVMPLMSIASPVTGRRGVSLPFSDFCDFFGPNDLYLDDVVRAVLDYGRHIRWDYVEWRTTGDFVKGMAPSESFLTHDLDLERTEMKLFCGIRESKKRNIRRAQKDGVHVGVDNTAEFLLPFYRLHCQTRRRHGLPPQPFLFFRNIRDDILLKGLGVIVSAFYSGKIIASSIFLHFGEKAIFKYGASDLNFLGHRPNDLLMWEAIRWYKEQGFKNLNLGRTEPNNLGLLRFKRSWGSDERQIRYYRISLKKKVARTFRQNAYIPCRILAKAPILSLRLIGRLLYRHIG